MTRNIVYLSDFKEFNGGYVTFGGGAHGGRIFVWPMRCEMMDEMNVISFFKFPRKDNMYSFDIKNIVPKESLTCLVAKATSDESMLWHRRLGHINFKNINKLVKDNLVRGIKREYIVAKTPQQNGVTKRRNRTLTEAVRTMLADTKLPTTFWAEAVSTACYVQNRVLVVKPHNKTPYELFRVVAGTILNESAGTQEELNAGTSTQKEEISQDCIVMPIWKDASYFDSPFKDVGNGEPKSASDDQKQCVDDKSKDNSSPKEVNVAGQYVNTASLEVNTGRFKLNIVDPSVNTASSNNQDRPKDMFKLGASHTLEATHIEPTSINKALSDSSWVEAMQEELLQFKLQQVWKLVDLPNGKRAIRTKWISLIGSLDVYQQHLRPRYYDLQSVHVPYSQDSLFELVAYTDSDYAGATQDKKFTTGGSLWLLRCMNVRREYVAAASCCGQVGDEAVHKELGNIMERVPTTASSLEVEQDSDAQTRFETTSKQSNNSPLSRVNTLGYEWGSEDNMYTYELIAHCATNCRIWCEEKEKRDYSEIDIQKLDRELCDKK
ncbi:ribonuclease H-like domain-containing protein [Tanacetum coccineum]